MFVISQYGETSLPDLNCPNLRRMIFEDYDGIKFTESDRLGADDWESIFWDLPVCAPFALHYTTIDDYS